MDLTIFSATLCTDTGPQNPTRFDANVCEAPTINVYNVFITLIKDRQGGSFLSL